VSSPSNPPEPSFAEALQAFESGPTGAVEPGAPRRGVVAAVTAERVFVDIGGKSEGVIPVAELRQPLQRGDEITVSIAGRDADGYLLLSPMMAGRPRDWTALQQAFDTKQTIAGRVTGVVKGGLSVDVGVRAFLPASRSGCRETADLEKLVEQEIRCRIIQLDVDDENVILDRRAVLEEEALAALNERLTRLEAGAVVRGTVRRVTEFGAFVDLGGVEGLLHASEMAWTRVEDPKSIVSVGEELDVQVLQFDREKRRISLGRKQLTPDPWAAAAERWRPGDRVRGTVTRVTDFGAFVELEPGVEGLVHVSEMSWARRVRHPRDVVKPGDAVDAVVLGITTAERRISLGLKQALGDPWADLEERFPVGKAVDGTVRNIEKFGAFVELADGIEGLLHVSDLTGERRVNHPNELLKADQRVRVVVLEIDRAKKRLKLGMKQLEPDALDEYLGEHKPGDLVTGRVRSVGGGEARVELGDGVIGFCALEGAAGGPTTSFGAQLAAVLKREPAAAAVEPIQVGQICSFVIEAIDAASRRIELTAKTPRRQG